MSQMLNVYQVLGGFSMKIGAMKMQKTFMKTDAMKMQ